MPKESLAGAVIQHSVLFNWLKPVFETKSLSIGKEKSLDVVNQAITEVIKLTC